MTSTHSLDPITLDKKDPLKDFRNSFNFPESQPVYLCGHSLGLQPKSAKKYVDDEMISWMNMGVEGHLSKDKPWFSYHELLSDPMSKIVGAKQNETVVMNSLTTNLHLMMISFFKPTKEKYKILIDTPSFPSDKYAVQSQLKLNGLNPERDLIEVNTLDGSRCLTNEEILNNIESKIDNVSMILLSGVNYYTGQFYDISSVAKIAKENNCVLGLDLAHAAGNVPLSLHDWGVDFSAWCGYKYLNGGPGAPSGAYIHERHHNKDLNRLEGWWGHDKKSRFDPPKIFSPIKSAEAWQLSNPPILSMAALLSSIELFDQVGMSRLREKSTHLTSYLEHLIKSLDTKKIKIITPSDKMSRGAQLSLLIDSNESDIKDFFKKKNIICDFRKPNVIRAAPCPMYNSFMDIFNFVEAIKDI